MLLKSLFIIGALSGTILGSVGTSVPLLFPQAFSPDAEVIMEVSSFAFLSFGNTFYEVCNFFLITIL